MPTLKDIKPARLATIDALPDDMQANALVDWATVAAVCGYADVEYCREIISKQVPLVHLTARKKLPAWGDLRSYLESRKSVAAA